jgi:two-component system, cell cycle response regulator
VASEKKSEAEALKDRILVLDDEPSILEILGCYLDGEAYECTLTTSALDALGKLEKEHYSLLITDLKMPEMHGIEVVQRAKSFDPDIAVIVVTALLEATNAIDAMRAGADDYLLKPFNLGEITLSVERALERRQLILSNRRHHAELEERIREATADLERTNRELLSTKEYLESLLHSTVDAIFTCNLENGEITFVNMGAYRMLDYSENEFQKKGLGELLPGGSEEYAHVVRLLEEEGRLQNYETELKHRSEHKVPVNMSISKVRGADNRSEAMLAICKDITAQKELERELKEMSNKDSLTGLYNQRCFYDRLESEMERARRQGHPLSLLLFDIDQFKTYNDCRGHLEGDNVLKAAGQVVLECTREHVDIGFRYGGDEFTIILPEADEKQALQIAERIRESFENRHFDDLTLSVGVMEYRKGDSQKSFIRFADAMMYNAKRSGGNRVCIFKPENDPE